MGAAGGALLPGYDAALRLPRGSCAEPCQALKSVTFPASVGEQQELQLAPGLATCPSTCDFGEPGCSCSMRYSLMSGSVDSTWDFHLEEGTGVLLGDAIAFTVTSGGPTDPPEPPRSEPPPPDSSPPPQAPPVPSSSEPPPPGSAPPPPPDGPPPEQSPPPPSSGPMPQPLEDNGRAGTLTAHLRLQSDLSASLLNFVLSGCLADRFGLAPSDTSTVAAEDVFWERDLTVEFTYASGQFQGALAQAQEFATGVGGAGDPEYLCGCFDRERWDSCPIDRAMGAVALTQESAPAGGAGGSAEPPAASSVTFMVRTGGIVAGVFVGLLILGFSAWKVRRRRRPGRGGGRRLLGTRQMFASPGAGFEMGMLNGGGASGGAQAGGAAPPPPDLTAAAVDPAQEMRVANPLLYEGGQPEPQAWGGGWERHVDPETWHEYYYNAATGETAWEPPPGRQRAAGFEDVTL